MHLFESLPIVAATLAAIPHSPVIEWMIIIAFFGALTIIVVGCPHIIVEESMVGRACDKLRCVRATLKEMEIKRGKRTRPPFIDTRVAVFGDVLGNLEALQAVIADARARGVRDFACVGDVVGRYANPNECIRILRKLKCPVVLGDMDHLVAHKRESLDPIKFHKNELRAIKWTRKVIKRSHRKWLQRLPYVWHAHRVTFVHASLARPECFEMIEGEQQAWESFFFQKNQTCFYGHGPSVYTPRDPSAYCRCEGQLTRESGTIKLEKPGDFIMDVGSTGGSYSHASYVIFDPVEGEIKTHGVLFDHQETMDKCHRAKFLGNA